MLFLRIVSLILVIFSLNFSPIIAQELNATVEINTQKIEGTNKSIFENLKTTLTEFINDRQWTEYQFKPNERIKCSFTIIVNKYTEVNSLFECEAYIQSTRPVFNSAYTTTSFQLHDKKFYFNFQEFDQLNYDDEHITNTLTALIAYYCYLIIGVDMDTMSPLGGKDLLQKAMNIADNAQNMEVAGWKALEDLSNRYGIINDLVSEGMAPLRQLQYDYYRKGLDQMATDPENSRNVILETIVTMKAFEEDLILGTKGFEELGVSSPIRISPDSVLAGGKKSFVKTVSGFGGANAAILACCDPDKTDKKSSTLDFIQTHSVRITPSEVIVDGTALPHPESISGKELLSFLYKEKVGGYPQFYKMDLMTRLGFIASELLLEAEGKERFAGTDSRAVILFNRSSSLTTDRKYLETISEDNYFPSPSLFVYTLPNIITGEIAIRNKYNGETSFHILPEKDMDLIKNVLKAALGDRKTQSVISGWIDCYGETRFEAELFIAEKKKNDYEREN